MNFGMRIGLLQAYLYFHLYNVGEYKAYDEKNQSQGKRRAILLFQVCGHTKAAV